VGYVTVFTTRKKGQKTSEAGIFFAVSCLGTSIGDVLRAATRLLAVVTRASRRLEAELLLCEATGLERTRLLAWPNTQIGEKDLQHFWTLVQRRLAGEPIAYIRGHQPFWTLDLRVTPDTLIPRPETELLVALTLDRLPADAALRVLDAGCGSGAIAAVLASERPAWTLIATDRSMPAARVARQNLCRYALNNAEVVNCNWLAPFAERSLHAIVGNPPYVPDADPHLDQGDLPWEPRSALAAGPDGLDAIRALSAQGAARLRHAGFIALEHGFDQGPAVGAILVGQGFQGIRTHRDLSGWERVTTGLLAD
jgi:release factor glutamine methyltransferase